jgi:hypothetical protein
MTYHPAQPTFACEDPRATRALTDPTTARPQDAEWVKFFLTQGKCTRVSASSEWDMVSVDGDIALMQDHRHPDAPPLFLSYAALVAGNTSPPNPAGTDAPGPNAPGTNDTNPSSNAPDPSAPPATPSDAFTDGQAARRAWDDWLASLQGNDRAGAEYWTRQFSSPGAGTCESASMPPEWHDGCVGARLRSLASDVRRRSEPYYAQGWNDPTALAPPPQVASAATPPKEESEQSKPSFRAGQADRKKWDEWFSGFLGDYRAGAAYSFNKWTTAPGPVPRDTCTDQQKTETWRDGCEMARRKLAAFDARRQSDMTYLKGWGTIAATP